MPFWKALGKAFGITTPWGAVAWGATIASSILLSKFLRPKAQEAPTRESRPLEEEVNRRWILGKRRRVTGKLVYASIVEPTSSAKAIPGSYKDNHLRLIYVLSEGAIGDIKGVYIDDSKYVALSGTPKTPTVGYDIKASEVSKWAFPQSHTIQVRQFFAADGASQPLIQTSEAANRRFHNVVPNNQDPSTYTGGGIWENFPNDTTDYYTDNQSATPPANTQVPFDIEYKPWTAEHKLTGVSYVEVSLLQPFHQEDDPNDDYFRTIPRIEFLVGGLKFNTPNSPTTKVESENPIDQLYWYDTEILKIPAANIDTTAYNTARAICEETLSFDRNEIPAAVRSWLGTYRTFKKYTANHIVEEGEEKEAVHTRLLAACAGWRYEAGGKIYYNAGKERTSVLTLLDDELEDVVEVKPWPSIGERYNQITVQIPQSRAFFQKPDEFTFKDDPAFMRDGELRNIDINLECVDHPLQCYYLASVLTKQQRQSFTFSAIIPPLDNMDQLTKIRPGNKVTITNTELGLVSRECIVQSVNIRNDFRISATFKLNTDNVYSKVLRPAPLQPRGLAFSPYVRPTPPTNLISDEIATINKDGTVFVRLDVGWDRADSIATEVQARIKTPQGEWQPLVSNANGISASLHGVEVGKTYQIRARHFSKDNIGSNWVNADENTIDGDLTPPGPITNFSATSLPGGIHAEWTNPTDLDFASICIYVSSTEGFVPSDSNLVDVLVGTMFESGGYAVGVKQYVRARAKDTSGNLGELTAEMEVTPTAIAGEGATIHTGSGEPSGNLGKSGDIYIRQDGAFNGLLYRKLPPPQGFWVNTGVDITATQAELVPFGIPATPSNPRPVPPEAKPIGSIAFNTATGQYWERGHIRGIPNWIYRGDLTGAPGKNASGIITWAGSLLATKGAEGDITLDPATSNWYVWESGRWVLQANLKGPRGTGWRSIANPDLTLRYGARQGGLLLDETTGSYYRYDGTDTQVIWTLVGDLQGDKIVFYDAPDGTNPLASNPDSVVRAPYITDSDFTIGASAVNTRSAEVWTKTSTGSSPRSDNWTKQGDLGNGKVTLTDGDPPTIDGVKIGDITIANALSNNKKIYEWKIDTTKVPPDTEPSWVFVGYMRGFQLSVGNAFDSSAITGDLILDGNGDIVKKTDTGTMVEGTTRTPPLDTRKPDVESLPANCRVYEVSQTPPSSLGQDGNAALTGPSWWQKANGSWSQQTTDLVYGKSNGFILWLETNPGISFNTPGYRATVVEANRPYVLNIHPSDSTAWAYAYDTSSWTKVATLCSGVVVNTLTGVSNFRRTSTNESTSVTVAWNADPGVDSYDLSISPVLSAGLSASNFNVGKAVTTYTISGLSRGTTYTVSIKKKKGTQTGPETTLSFRTSVDPSIELPNQPASVTVTPSQTVQGRVEVAWTAGAITATKPVTGWVIQFRRSNGTIKTQGAGAASRSFTVLGVPAGTGTTVRIYAANSKGGGPYRTSASFTVPTITPAPTALQPPRFLNLFMIFNANDTEEIRAIWAPVTGATQYSYDISPNIHIAPGGGGVRGDITTPQKDFPLLASADGVEHTVTITAKDATRESNSITGTITPNIDNLGADNTGSGARAVTGMEIEVPASLTQNVHVTFVNTTNREMLLRLDWWLTRVRGSLRSTLTSEMQAPLTTSRTRVLVQITPSTFTSHMTGDTYTFHAQWVYSDGAGPVSTIAFRRD